MDRMQKGAEENLRESEERYKFLTESIMDAILILDFKAKILFANEAAVKMSGFSSLEELIGKNALDLIAPGYRAKVIKDQILVNLGRGGFLAEYKALKKDGKEFWIEGLGQKISFQGKPANIVTLRDITGRKQAEEETKKEKEKLEVLLKNMAALVSAHESTELLKLIADNARKISGALLVILTLYDEKRTGVQIKLFSGFDQPIIREAVKILNIDFSEFFFPTREDSIVKWMLDNKKTFITDSFYVLMDKLANKTLCDTAQKLTGVKKMIDVPLFYGDKFLGQLVYFIRGEGEIDLKFLETFANQCATALNAAMIVEQIKGHSKELEKINKFMVGRELDMVQLKKEVNAMLKELGRDEKYRV